MATLKKAKQLTFPLGLKQVVKFLEGDEKMMMIRDGNSDDPSL